MLTGQCLGSNVHEPQLIFSQLDICSVHYRWWQLQAQTEEPPNKRSRAWFWVVLLCGKLSLHSPPQENLGGRGGALHSKTMGVYSDGCFRSQVVVVNSTQSIRQTHAEVRTMLWAVLLRRSVHTTVSSFLLLSEICNMGSGMESFLCPHSRANLLIAISTLIILSPSISSVVKFVISKFCTTLPASDQSTSTNILSLLTKMSICPNSPLLTSSPSST